MGKYISEKMQKMIDEFVKNGGNVQSLTKKDKLYQYIHNTKVVDVNGRALSMEEKFADSGYPRERAKAKDVKETLKKHLDAFLKAGGNVNDLKRNDPLCLLFKSARVLDENGRKLSLQQKFALFGQNRDRRYTDDLEKKLRNEIEEFQKNGGSFHIPRKKLPFYPTLMEYKRRRFKDLQPEKVMKNLGYNNYSDIYFSLKDLDGIKKFRDEEGFVDSYRKDAKFHNLVKARAEYLNISPDALVILFCDERLRNVSVNLDYVKYVQNELQQYISSHENSLVGFSNENPQLYQKFRRVKDFLTSNYEFDKVDDNTVLDFFDIEEVKHRLRIKPRDKRGDKEFVEKLVAIAKENNMSLKKDDISQKEYTQLVKLAIAREMPIKELLSSYGIDYAKGNIATRLGKVVLSDIPNIGSMKKMRDEIIKESGVSLENGNCIEEVVEVRAIAVEQAFKHYTNGYEDLYPKAKNIDNKIVQVGRVKY